MGNLVSGQHNAQQALAAARHLAAAGEAHQYLTFLLGGEMYAVAILNVKEIIEYGQLTGIPMMPAFIRRVINLRGAGVPVIDLAARFGGHQTESSRRTCIVIIELSNGEEHHDIGVVVDAVSEVLEVPGADIEPAPRPDGGRRWRDHRLAHGSKPLALPGYLTVKHFRRRRTERRATCS
ncbi:MAG: purine-binding chemotaxis protein CheW [Sulfuritalea sp.]|nr:purine-binding chemotaxis protein CheW [Sulfuritalea sp.]MBK8118936.1 purine-binding chemotaxis protein CheW [Sulfuritalea sp.]